MSNLFRVEPPTNPSPSTDNVIANTKLLKSTVGWVSKNLFNPEDNKYEYAIYGTEGSGAYIGASTGGLTYIAQVENDKEYTISKKSGQGNAFIIAGFTTLPTIGGATPETNSEVIVDDSSLASYTFDSESYNYIAFTVNKGSGNSHTIANTAQGMIYDADIIDDTYEPYNVNVDMILYEMRTDITNDIYEIRDEIDGLLDYFYPIGTIYETLDSTFNPNTAWGGYWEKIEGKFLLGSSNDYVIGSTGGEATHKLTTSEMPKHSHQYKVINTSSAVSASTNGAMAGNPNDLDSEYIDTDETGGSKEHNNMPPYITVNIWERKTPPSQVVPFDTATDAQINQIINAYYNGDLSLADIQEVWSVGDTRDISLESIPTSAISEGSLLYRVDESHHAQTVTMRIIDFDHDTLTTPINGITKALITVDLANCLRGANTTDDGQATDTEIGYMNSSIETDTGWSNSRRRAWCNRGFFNALPYYLQGLNKPVNKLTATGNGTSTLVTTSDRVFLESEVELANSTNKSYSGEGTQYAYYALSVPNRSKLPTWGSGALSAQYWLRSPANDENNYFCNVMGNGGLGRNTQETDYGLAPAWCM